MDDRQPRLFVNARSRRGSAHRAQPWRQRSPAKVRFSHEGPLRIGPCPLDVIEALSYPGAGVDIDRPIDAVLAYHQATKHHPQRYARALGYMDWATQPDPFRRYRPAPLVALDPFLEPGGAPYDGLFQRELPPVARLDRAFVSQLLHDSLALSAWKQFRGNRWSLRVNPSSGNLHPTEGYLVLPPGSGFGDEACVAHYAPFDHGLEIRARIERGEWERLSRGLPPGALLAGLSSIHWREAWKYGERAYRYCQHDAGHAIAAIGLAARLLGWETRLLDGVGDEEIGRLLGLDAVPDIESEHPDCLLALFPGNESFSRQEACAYRCSVPWDVGAMADRFVGHRNRLSKDHHRWPIIDAVAAAATHRGAGPLWSRDPEDPEETVSRPSPAAREIIRRRRSAVAMDGETRLPAASFFEMLRRVMPSSRRQPFAAFPWVPRVHLLLFVHRVDGVAPGLYLLMRDPSRSDEIRQAIGRPFELEPVQGAGSLPLWRLESGDARGAARTVSCGQEIAADGAFAVAMIGELAPALRESGPSFYRRIHWEAGAVGQVLYLEAEASGVRATGIGCFFDDLVHDMLGIRSPELQSIYHFTVGGPVEDERLATLPAYAHLREEGSAP